MADNLVTYAISIPADIVQRLEIEFAKYLKPPRTDPETKAVVRDALFPNGVIDWLQQTIGANIQGTIGQEEQQALQDEMAQIQAKAQAKWRPVIEVKKE